MADQIVQELIAKFRTEVDTQSFEKSKEIEKDFEEYVKKSRQKGTEGLALQLDIEMRKHKEHFEKLVVIFFARWHDKVDWLFTHPAPPSSAARSAY